MVQLNQAFIFAAGRGERMRPLTDNIPKPLVKINNRPIIDYSLEKISHTEITKVIINGFYLADQIADFINKKNDAKIIFSEEKEKLETGGGLVFALDKIDLENPLLIINGDILWQESGLSDINLLWQKWLKIKAKDNSCEILLGLKAINQYHGYHGNGDFDLVANDYLVKKDSTMSHAYVGLAIIDPKILLRSPEEKCFSMSYFFNEKLEKNKKSENIRGLELSGNYFHIGDIAAISSAEERIK